METNRIVRLKGKFYDMGTPNVTFRVVAKTLKKAGIKNWYFMLEIKDYSLTNIDPHACDKAGHTKLTADQVNRVITECTRNPWYFLREVVRINGTGGTIPYKANRGNIAQAWCFLNHIDSWLCLPRQQGKTISALAIILWAYIFGCINSSFMFINKDSKNAKTNLNNLAKMIDVLPEYMRFTSITDEDGKVIKAKRNATQLTHPVNKNSIDMKPKATSYEAALNIPRGFTSPIIHYDEPEFTPYIDVIVENSVSTFNTASRNAIENGYCSARIFTCTPGDLDTNAGQAGAKLLSKTVAWSEQFYDYGPEKVKKMMIEQRSNNITYIEYSFREIGLTNKWFEKIAAEIGNPLTVRREILLQRLHGSDLSPFDRDDIEAIIERQQEPIDTIYLQDYFELYVYSPLIPSIPYIVGVDCSTGTGGDNNAITIINPYTVIPVAELQSPYIGESEFEKLILELVTKYIPKAIVCIERNSIGDGIIDHLIKTKIADNIYFDKEKDLVEAKMREASTIKSMLATRSEIKKCYGVYTQGKSRETMMSILANHVKVHKDRFVMKLLIKDVCGLIRKPSGKVEAKDGDHDDNVMSYLIGLYVYYHGDNLSRFGFIKDMEIDTSKPMHREIDIDALLPKEVADAVKKEHELENRKTFESELQEYGSKMEKQSIKLYLRGMLDSDVYDNTRKEVLTDTYSEEYEDDYSLFDDLNML